MPDLSYWERRQVEDAFETFTEAEAIADQISTLYFNASRQLSREARGIFDRFRRKYGLSEEEARHLLGRLQDSTSLKQLQRMLRNTQQTDEIVALRKEIESAAFRVRLDRLQAMQNNLDLIMRQIYKRELKINTDFYTNLADKSYYRCMYRMQQRANAAFGFSHISQKVIDDVVRSRWSGKNFSARIWGNTTALANTLKEEMLVGLVTGRTLRDTAGVIAEKCSQSANNARRLVRTESNYIHTQMNFEAYEEAGVEKYLYLATLDLRTSKICRSLDGEIFPVKDQKIGVNCPPMHPWCRSTTIAILDEDLLKTMQRSAIDPVTGKRIKVPATMKYQEWYDKYVVGRDDEISSRQLPERNVDRQQFERYRERGIGPETYEEFRNVKYGETERYEQLKRDFRDTKQFENYKDILGDDAPETLEEFQQIKYNTPEEWNVLRAKYRLKRRQEKEAEPKEFRFADKTDYSRMARAHKKNVTREDVRQIHKHTKSDGSPGGYVATHNYSNINSNLRDDGWTGNQLDADDYATIDAMKRAIAANTLDDDYVLTRYVNASYLTDVFGIKGAKNEFDTPSVLNNSFNQLSNKYVVDIEMPRITKELQGWIGRDIPPDSTFLSTSLVKEKNIMKDKPVLLQIKAPKGTHCYIPKNIKESECILPDNQRMMIEDVEYSAIAQKWIITARLL